MSQILTVHIQTSEAMPAADARCQPAPKPLLTICARTGWAVDFAELWRFRDLLLALAYRDVKLRYRQTALGVTWVVAQPLLAAGIFAFVFGKIAKLTSGEASYFIFSFAGLLAWNVFGGITSKASGCLVGNSQLISKVYFPRMLIPLAAVLSSLIDFVVALVVLIMLMVVQHTPAPGARLLLLPVAMLLMVMMATGVALYLSALTVRYRDVQYVLPVLLQCLLYASPVAYGMVAVPAPYRWICQLNPLVGPLEAFRWSLLGVGELNVGYLVYSVVFAVLTLAAGILSFNLMQRRFADVI